MGIINGAFAGGMAPGMQAMGAQLVDYGMRENLMKKEAEVREAAAQKLAERSTQVEGAQHERNRKEVVADQVTAQKDALGLIDARGKQERQSANTSKADDMTKTEIAENNNLLAEFISTSEAAAKNPSDKEMANNAEVLRKQYIARTGKDPRQSKGGDYSAIMEGDETGVKRLTGTLEKNTGTITRLKPENNEQTFSTPAEVQAAKAAGKIKSGDIINTPNGQMKVK